MHLERVLLAVIGAMVLCGCGELGIGPQTCARPESDDPLPFHGGFVEGDTYMSSNWAGDLLHFPGGAYYEIHHQLGAVPNGVQFYLSFSGGGVESA